MSMRTVPCREASCKAPMVWIESARDPGKRVPVDADSLSEDDVKILETGGTVTYSPRDGHVSHFKTCKAPNRFSGGRK